MLGVKKFRGERGERGERGGEEYAEIVIWGGEGEGEVDKGDEVDGGGSGGSGIDV